MWFVNSNKPAWSRFSLHFVGSQIFHYKSASSNRINNTCNHVGHHCSRRSWDTPLKICCSVCQAEKLLFQTKCILCSWAKNSGTVHFVQLLCHGQGRGQGQLHSKHSGCSTSLLSCKHIQLAANGCLQAFTGCMGRWFCEPSSHQFSDESGSLNLISDQQNLAFRRDGKLSVNFC